MRLQFLRTLGLIFLILFILSNKSYAGPLIKLCLNNDCKKRHNVEISDACWSEVKEIFAPPFPTDKDEQDNIVNAIALIESDIYSSVSKQNPQGSSASDLYTANSTKNNYRNIKKYLGVLLDNYLVKRHYLRKIITQSNWAGIENSTLLLQSLTDSKLYTLEANNSELGASAIIRPYSTSPLNTNNKKTTGNDNSSQENNDFE